MPKRKQNEVFDDSEKSTKTSGKKVHKGSLNEPVIKSSKEVVDAASSRSKSKKGSLNSREQVNELTLGHDWGQWYQFDPKSMKQFLPQNSLIVRTSKEFKDAMHAGGSVQFNLGIADAKSGHGRSNIVELLQHLKLKQLVLDHTSFELPAKSSGTKEAKSDSKTCSNSCLDFLTTGLKLQAARLEQLTLNLLCTCKIDNNNGNAFHAKQGQPILGKEHLAVISQCQKLNKLVISQSISPEASPIIATMKNITHLKLAEIGSLTDEALLALQPLSLSSLSFASGDNSPIAITPDGLNALCTGAFVQRLTTLSLRFPESWGSDKNSRQKTPAIINTILKAASNLEDLELKLKLYQHPQVKHLNLKRFVYDVPIYQGDTKLWYGHPVRKEDHPLSQLNNLQIINIAQVLLPKKELLDRSMFASVESIVILGHLNFGEIDFFHNLLPLCPKLLRLHMPPLTSLEREKKGHNDYYGEMKFGEEGKKEDLKDICNNIATKQMEDLKLPNVNDFGGIKCNYFMKRLGSMTNLKSLDLSFTKEFCPKWFASICSNLPTLGHLSIAPWNDAKDPQPCNLNLMLMDKLTQLVTFHYVASWSPATHLATELFVKCNTAFPVEATVDTMSKWPQMREFVVKDSETKTHLTYFVRKTCLGEIKRILQTRKKGAKGENDPKDLITVGLEPEHVSTNTLPPACSFPEAKAKGKTGAKRKGSGRRYFDEGEEDDGEEGESEEEEEEEDGEEEDYGDEEEEDDYDNIGRGSSYGRAPMYRRGMF